MRLNLLAPAALLVVAAACDDAPRALGPAETIEAQSAGFSAVNPAGKTDGIADLIAAQEAAWADKDATAYAATYTEDAELINPVAGILAGREVIRTQHAFLFNPVNGPFRASTSSLSLRDLIFLSGNVALVKLDVTLTGMIGLPPGLPMVEPGVVRTRVSWIAVRQGREWRILFQQMTPFPAPN